LKKIAGALTATAIALTAATAFAGSTAAPNSLKKVHAEWAKSRAQGGYGFPLVAVPMAIANAIAGKPSRPPIAQSQDSAAKSN
jgi:hypothetical protein